MTGSGLQWQLTWQGKQYTFSADDITVGGLRQIKGWFPDIGRNMKFQTALLEQDPEAVLCAIWLARRAAGETGIEEPNQMPDFKIADVIEFGGAEPVEEDPTGAEAEETPVSTETPTNSAPSTSESSPMSATSQQET